MQILILILILAAVYVLVCIIATEVMYRMIYKRYDGTPYTTVKLYPDYQDRYPREMMTFPSGKYMLQGYLYGAGNTRGLVVFTHGIWSFHEEYLSVMLHMVDLGFQVFTFDIRGCGKSPGKNCRSMDQSAMDLHAALTYVESNPRFQGLKVITMGHSWGGFATAAALNFDHRIAAAIPLSGFNDANSIMRETLMKKNPLIAKLLMPYGDLELRLRYGKNAHIRAVDGINKAASQGTAVLITHGDKDEMIEYNGASIISHKEEITNPKVTYYTFSRQGLNLHNSFFNTARAQNYFVETFRAYQKLEAQYPKKKVPDEVKEAFYRDKDKDIANELSEEFCKVIDDFLTKEGL